MATQMPLLLLFCFIFIRIYNASSCDFQIWKYDDAGSIAANAGYTRAAFDELKSGGFLYDEIVNFANANNNAFKALGTWSTGQNCLYYNGPCTIATASTPQCSAISSWTGANTYYLCPWSGRTTIAEGLNGMLGTAIHPDTIAIFYKCNFGPTPEPTKFDGPTSEPTAYPADQCTWISNPNYIQGVTPGYVLPGVPAIVGGDPHFRTWNNLWHDFQGTSDDEQYYYMHPCKKDIDGNLITRTQMPFTLLGKHESVNPNIVGVRGLDYITLELYDNDNAVHLVWLSSSLHTYVQESVNHPSSFYDDNPTGTIDLISGDNTIGNRFKINFRQSSTSRIDVTLTIDGECDVTLFMYSQGMYRNGRNRMHGLQVNPPECYKCYTCGLFGEFINQNWRVKTCTGGVIQIARGWYRGSAGFTTAYEKRALTWEKSFVEANCPFWQLRRRRLIEPVDDAGENALEEPFIDPQIEANIQDPCEQGSVNQIAANNACANARAAEQDCCNAFGATCDELETGCQVDACALADIMDVNVAANDIFANGLAELCADGLDIVQQQNNLTNVEVPDNAPVDCITEWTQGKCSVACGGGTATRIGQVITPAENGGVACPISLEEEVSCNTFNCCYDPEISSFDWDLLQQTGEGKPDVIIPENGFEVDDADLSLNIVVRLPYLGQATANNEVTPRWPLTYVLDFDDFDAYSRSINLPGTCENRAADAFIGKEFSDWWGYSLHPQFNIAQEEEDLSYPPPGDFWTVDMLDDDCATIEYKGSFTWKDLIKCTSSEDSNSYVTVDNSDDDYLKLLGTFYVNVVSPFYPENDFGYYRVYQLFSQPFVIQIAKTVNVLGSTGINLMTLSVTAVYKSNDKSNFNLILMSETSDYMYLQRNNDGSSLFTAQLDQPSNEASLVAPTAYQENTQNENTNGCLNTKSFICAQLWKIEAINIECIQGQQSTDFSGTYHLGFNPVCRDNLDTQSLQHCQDFISQHNLAANVELQTDIVWKDEICSPLTFTTQFSAQMTFHENEDWDNAISTEHLYQAGEDKIYVEISTDFPVDTFDVFDTKLIQVFICTFDPAEDVVTDPTQLTTFGCNGNRDNMDESFYRIYNSNPNTISAHNFNLIADTETNIIRFSFHVPRQVNRDTLYIQAELEVSLVQNGVRRRILGYGFALDAHSTSQIQHFINSIGINHGQKPIQQPININNKPIQQPPPQQPQIPIPQQPFTISLNSTWIIVIGALLAIILTFNIIFMCYMNCCKAARPTISFNKNRRSGYHSVKNDSEEFDDSEANLINVHQ